jgi:hypothetical protein
MPARDQGGASGMRDTEENSRQVTRPAPRHGRLKMGYGFQE